MSPTTLRPAGSLFQQIQIRFRQASALTTTLLLAISSTAQQSTSRPESSTENQTASLASNNATASVPAGTRIALVLTQPIQTRYLHRGDDIYAQITSPVTAHQQLIIPPGTFVQGTVDKLERHGGRAELRLQSLTITFPDGYAAPVAGPVTLQTDDGYAVKDPGKGRLIGAFALPAAGAGLGALIGHAAANSQPQTITSSLPPGCSGPPPFCVSSSLSVPASTAKDTGIGAAVGLAVGGVASLALLLGGHNFFIDAGSPVSMVLHQPIVLPEDEVADAIRDAQEHPAPVEAVVPRPQPMPPANTNPNDICYTPGTPGTPDIDIPGTPAIGDTPGTPPTHIPGIPATPPTPHPCP
jgi:hypothetical protein